MLSPSEVASLLCMKQAVEDDQHPAYMASKITRACDDPFEWTKDIRHPKNTTGKYRQNIHQKRIKHDSIIILSTFNIKTSVTLTFSD